MKVLNKFFIPICFLLMGSFANAQNDAFLSQVNELVNNNKDYKALQQIAKQMKLETKTNIYPEGLNFGLEYLPAVDGNGYVGKWNISQSFDFPTSYIAAKKLRQTAREKIDLELAAARQDLAANIAVEITKYQSIYKQVKILKKQYRTATSLLDAVTKAFQEGEVGILALNKAHLFENQINIRLKDFENQLHIQKSLLVTLNGGNAVSFGNFKELNLALVSEQELKEKIMQKDASLKLSKIDIAFAEKEKSLTWNEKLPSFSLGFGQEGNQVETFRGITFGMNIPLWNKRGTINLAKAKKAGAESSYLALQSSKENEYLSNLKDLESSLALYRQSLDAFKKYNSYKLLETALKNGHISVVEFFREVNDYYDMELEIEAMRSRCDQQYVKVYKFDF